MKVVILSAYILHYSINLPPSAVIIIILEEGPVPTLLTPATVKVY